MNSGACEEPTLFGLAYASRLFTEVEKGFDEFYRTTGGAPNFANSQHGPSLLKWLNLWGCRISKSEFPAILDALASWYEKWISSLEDLDLINMQDQHLDVLAAAYDDLVKIKEFGPTSASKTLFAVCQRAAMMWDAPIQARFENYRSLVRRSQCELMFLLNDAARCGITDHSLIPRIICSPQATLPKLLDEYHWVTITRRHKIPTSEELTRWVAWASSGPER